MKFAMELSEHERQRILMEHHTTLYDPDHGLVHKVNRMDERMATAINLLKWQVALGVAMAAILIPCVVAIAIQYIT